MQKNSLPMLELYSDYLISNVYSTGFVSYDTGMF